MLTQVIIWLNWLAGWLAGPLAVLRLLPDWLAMSLIAAVSGILMLLIFKQTSRQQQIQRIRNRITAHLLGLSLFQDHLSVSLRAQFGLLCAAGQLFLQALWPMAVMLVPTLLLLGQLSLWCQARPLRIGERAIVTLEVRTPASELLDQLTLDSAASYRLSAGPVRVPSQQKICWEIEALQPGLSQLVINHQTERFTKELAIGNDWLPVSLERPDWDWSSVLLHPREQPFSNESPVASISVSYPPRYSWTAGTNTWLWYWFGASMVFGYLARPWLKVAI
jgi:hypothetical protein